MSAQGAGTVSTTSAAAPSRTVRMTPPPGDDEGSSMRWRVLEGCSSPATAAADLCKTSAQIKASRRPTHGASRFSLLLQASGFGERPPAARAIAAGVEPLGAAQGCREGRLRPLVGALHRARGRLVTELGAD